MIKASEFLKEYGIDREKAKQLHVGEIEQLLIKFGKKVRDEQALVSAASAARYTAIEVRGVEGRITSDFHKHTITPKIEIK